MASSDENLVFAPEWADWLIENFVEGVGHAELTAALEGVGVTPSQIRTALAELGGQQSLRALRRKVAERDQLAALLRLKGELAALSGRSGVERRASVSADEFFENYYFANRPVILTDVANRWKALELWSRPQYFAEKFGDTELTVCMGRAGDPYCDRNFEKYQKTMTMRQYAAWVEAAGETNDGYLISNNRLLENPAFHALLEDIEPPRAYVAPERFFTHMSFWFGPAGTYTPLHHDGNNILFCQVVGRKEFFLVSPWETELLKRAQGYYAHAQVPLDMPGEGLRPADEHFGWPAQRVVLNPGEALFLPVGWWHQVRALDLSVSISFLNFHVQNHFHWYAPGKLNEI